MVVNEHTRIVEIIKANADSIAALAGLAKPLRKLNNPLLRRIMAPRVTLAEAAAMGGCSMTEIRTALEPLGFQFEEGQPGVGGNKMPGSVQRPDWLVGAANDHQDWFDVRAIIDSGNDPLKAIMARYQALPQGWLLCVVNSFIPYPLVQLLAKKGALSYVDAVAVNEYHTWFLKPETPLESATSLKPADGKVVMHDVSSFTQLLATCPEAQRVAIDVRDLPMPQPMETILATLATLSPSQSLYIQHKRVPLHLLEVLADQDYRVHIHEVAEGNVEVLIVCI